MSVATGNSEKETGPSRIDSPVIAVESSTALDVIIRRGAQLLALATIPHDPDLQMRSAGVDPGVVAEYAEAMFAGAEFPPIVVFTDGEGVWPGDGFHRIEAAKKAARETILADVRDGSRRDAILHAVGANANHGLRRSNADKRRAVLAMLRDPEWSRLADREIGKRCAVDHKTVGNIRRELLGDEGTPRRTDRAQVGRGEIPQAHHGGQVGSIVIRLLARVSNEALVAECLRRRLEVRSHAD